MALEGGGPSAGNRENNRNMGSGSLNTNLILALLFAGNNADSQFSGKRTGCRRLRSRVVATYGMIRLKIAGAAEIAGSFWRRIEMRERISER